VPPRHTLPSKRSPTVGCHVMESTTHPIADYFWIAGVESISYNDPPLPSPQAQLESTIAEAETEDALESSETPSASPRATARPPRQSSNHRISKLSAESRFSIHTLDEA